MQIEVRDLRFALYVTERMCLLIDGLVLNERHVELLNLSSSVKDGDT